MAKRTIPIAELYNRPHQVPLGDPLTLVVEQRPGLVLEMEDLHFHHDSAVLLPDPKRDGTQGEPDEDQLTGLTVLRACYLQAKNNPAQKMLVVGHTDTTGKPGYNLTLSQLRAESVTHALLGKRDDWARVADSKHKVEDYQLILTWITETFAWDCDPGGVDDENGPKTKAAVRAFQKQYNARFRGKLAVDGVVGPETWKAFFDVYMSKLKKMLRTDDAGLDELRKELKFVDDGRRFVGCGESHPIAGERRDSFRSATNRRVEILFFDPGQEPKLDCQPNAKQCKPALCEIYRLKFYEFEPIPPEPHARGTLRIWLLDVAHRRMPGAPYLLKLSQVERRGKADGDGLLTETKVPLASSCVLEWGEPKGKSENDADTFRFRATLKLNFAPDSTEEQDENAGRMLENLGYTGTLDEMVAAFQSDYGLPEKAWFDQKTNDELIKVHENGLETPDREDDGPAYDPQFDLLDL